MSTATTATGGRVVASEDVTARKWDRCISNAIEYSGIGLAVGLLAGIVVFRRTSWPAALGLGFGSGMAYATCEFDFLHPDLIHGRFVKDLPSIKQEAVKLHPPLDLAAHQREQDAAKTEAKA